MNQRYSFTRYLFSAALYITFGIPLFVFAQPPSSGLAAYYSFSGNANDGSGNGNNGTVNGAVLAPDSLGNSNSAYRFDGTDDYINVPNSSSLQIADSVSIVFWAKRNQFGIDPILEKGGDWNANDPNYGIGFHNINGNMLYFWYDGGWRGTNGVSDTAWHLYAVIAKHGDANPTFYIDGVVSSVNSSGGTGTISMNSASTLDLHIGAQVAGGNTLYGGNTIDELRIYHRLLTADELADYPLPVEMVSLTAAAKGRSVELAWKTATEKNNHGFVVERSAVSGQWTEIGFVEGNGTVNKPKEYSYKDNVPAPGKYLYRLKQVDNDGAFEYSASVEVKVSQMPQKLALMQNHPNPFNPVTMINYQLPMNGHVTLKVYDMLGKEIAMLVNGERSAGEYTVPFDASSYPSGIYFYTLRTENSVETKKMSLIK